MDIEKVIYEAVEKCKPATRYRLAKRIGVTPATVYNWERGRAYPSGRHLAELLEMPPEATGGRPRGRPLALPLLLLLVALAMPQREAEAAGVASVEASTGIHIMRILRRWLRLISVTFSDGRPSAAMAF